MDSSTSPSQQTHTSFERLARAGQGGAAEVWKARTSTGAIVALKLARDDAAREAFAREATHALLALSPRIPALVDVGVLNDGTNTAFVALEWVEGRSLRAWMNEAREDRPRAALLILHDVAEALEDLHSVGLAHGDLKPENIIVDESGRAHLIDLGLSGSAFETTIVGATPRYLATSDSDLGDARARDLLALGIITAEILDASVAKANAILEAARRAQLPRPFDAISSALLTKNPGARPTARWVAETTLAFIGAQTIDLVTERKARDVRRIRATYLAVRRDDLAANVFAGSGTTRWLTDALAHLQHVRGMLRKADTAEQDDGRKSREVGPLDGDGITRWLTTLVGTSATAWPLGSLGTIDESTLASALERLAALITPEAWTFADLESVALGQTASAREQQWPPDAPLNSEDVVRLALAISNVPPDPLAIRSVEQHRDAPPTLVFAAADALRRAGQFGRARHLALRARELGAPGADALAADIVRRTGDLDAAREIASNAVAQNDAVDAARAVLARLAFDTRRLDEAEALAKQASSSAAEEVLALVASARGQTERARSAIRRGEAIARSDEQRARLSALRGYVEHGVDPVAAQRAFATAVDHAARAGALIEEATYRTGEAAAAVDVGDLDAALKTARRAAVLWEYLGKPAHAARALLAIAAAYETAGARHDAIRVAHEAIARAREGHDPRAEAYAWWGIADASPARSPEGRRAAERARMLLGDANVDDTLRADARLIEHAPESLDEQTYELRDAQAESTSVQPGARLDWLRVRADRLSSNDVIANPRTADRLLTILVSLSDTHAPIAARGPALAAGYALAARLGRGDVALRLLASLGDAARDLIARSPAHLTASIRALPWVANAAIVPQEGLHHEQARELERLIAALSERDRLRPLLERVVDALVLWTGVERGLLLLRAGDRLVPRAARNLARADLRGEQITLSHTLAQRALEALEPVVAVDAAGEMSSVHASVHALKLRSVLAVPLIARGEALGVVYLDDRIRKGAFGPRELAWTRAVASIAALAIADARAQLLLTRAMRRAQRATTKLEETLARNEAALDVAERELGRTRSSRETRFKYEAIIGESESIRGMLKIVDRVTLSNVPVLIHGESGSGKELIARAIHFNGPRATKPFVSENCSAIPETLLESTLFGHIRGAFTGADKPRLGLFDAADQGTLFLDEVGEMSLPMQAKLLRILEDGLVRPLGTERARKVDVRIIAATHRDLEAMVRARTFREDLLYRLNIIVVQIPPLRERADDVPLIVQHLLAKYDRPQVRVSRAAMDRLASFVWPGNVRQLENEIRRALVLCDDMIDREHLSPEIANLTPNVPVDLGLNVRPRVDALEVQLVREALERTRGNQTQAAKLLGLSRFGLQKMMKRLNVGG